MNRLKIQISIDLADIDLADQVAASVIEANVENVIRNAVDNGMITGDEDATIKRLNYECNWEEIFTIKRFVEELKDVESPIDAEEEFRFLYPGDPNKDKPAFREALNAYIDGNLKGREWVTFDNGVSYFTAQGVKDTIAVIDANSSTIVYDDSLRKVIDFWL